MGPSPRAASCLITTSNKQVRLTARNIDNDTIRRTMTEFGSISAEIRRCRAPERGNNGCRRVLVSCVDSHRRSLQTLTDLLIHSQSQRDVSGAMPKKDSLGTSQAPWSPLSAVTSSLTLPKEMTELAKSGRNQPRHWHSEGPGRRHR